MTDVTLPERKTDRKSDVSPHMPGRRRPQMRHSAASSRVSRPHEGQMIVRTSLRNIRLSFRGERLRADAVALVEPHAKIHEATRERAERPMGVGLPWRTPATSGAAHSAHARRGINHVHASYSPATKRVNTSTFEALAKLFPLTRPDPSRRLTETSLWIHQDSREENDPDALHTRRCRLAARPATLLRRDRPRAGRGGSGS